jgi:hypothetical protein
MLVENVFFSTEEETTKLQAIRGFDVFVLFCLDVRFVEANMKRDSHANL